MFAWITVALCLCSVQGQAQSGVERRGVRQCEAEDRACVFAGGCIELIGSASIKRSVEACLPAVPSPGP